MRVPEAVFKRCGEVELDIYEYANQALNTVLSIDLQNKCTGCIIDMDLSIGDVDDLIDYLTYVRDKHMV